MEDKTLTCRDCGKPFAFTAGEQQFFATKGLSDPSRCPDCRRIRRAQRAAEAGGPMPPGGPSGMDRGPASRSDVPSRPAPAPAGFRSWGRAESDAAPGAGDRVDRGPKRPRGEFDSRYKAPPKEAAAAAGRKERVRPRDRRREEERLVQQWRDEVGLDLDDE